LQGKYSTVMLSVFGAVQMAQWRK